MSEIVDNSTYRDFLLANRERIEQVCSPLTFDWILTRPYCCESGNRLVWKNGCATRYNFEYNIHENIFRVVRTGKH